MKKFSQLLVEKSKYFKEKYDLDLPDDTAQEYLNSYASLYIIFAKVDQKENVRELEKKMKQIKYYRIDDNFDLVEISKDNEIVKNYSSFGIELGKAHGVELLQLLKLEILPVDIKVAPIKELPDFYEKRRKQIKELQTEIWRRSEYELRLLWPESRSQKEKRENQQVLLRVNQKSKSYPEEYDRKNNHEIGLTYPKVFSTQTETG